MKEYLNEEQILDLQKQLEAIEGRPAEFGRIVDLVHTFVCYNGTRDAEYDALFDILTAIRHGAESEFSFSQAISTNIAILGGLAVYNYLLFTGVITPSELAKFGGPAFPGTGVPQA